MLIADLSIDFDYFVRELEQWGFDCDDSTHHAFDAWRRRYEAVDLRTETCIDRHADFPPELVIEALREKGIGLLPCARSMRRIGVADSHAEAFGFLRSAVRPPQLILNLDAHHDLFYDAAEVHCGNWAAHAMDLSPDLRYTQIYPSWKDPDEDATPCREVEMVRWDAWRGFDPAEDVRVRHVFLCRSGGWVPPHHDGRFFATVEALGKVGRVEWLESLTPRQAPWVYSEPTRAATRGRVRA